MGYYPAGKTRLKSQKLKSTKLNFNLCYKSPSQVSKEPAPCSPQSGLILMEFPPCRTLEFAMVGGRGRGNLHTST